MEQHEPAFDYVSPGVEINTKVGKFVLTHFNARLRLFDEPNGHFDHIEFESDEGNIIGFQPEPEVMAKFKEMDFPRLTLPFVDQGTFNWLTRVLSKDLEEAVGPEDVA